MEHFVRVAGDVSNQIFRIGRVVGESPRDTVYDDGVLLIGGGLDALVGGLFQHGADQCSDVYVVAVGDDDGAVADAVGQGHLAVHFADVAADKGGAGVLDGDLQTADAVLDLAVVGDGSAVADADKSGDDDRRGGRGVDDDATADGDVSDRAVYVVVSERAEHDVFRRRHGVVDVDGKVADHTSTLR